MFSTKELEGLGETLKGIQDQTGIALNKVLTPDVKAQLPDDLLELIDEGRSAISPKAKNGEIDFGKAADNANSVLRDINRTLQNFKK